VAFIGRMLLIVFAALLVGAWDSARRPVQLSAAPKPAASAMAPDANSSSATAAGTSTDNASSQSTVLGKDISVAQARSLYDNGAAFIDARTDAEWTAGRVPQAIHLSGEMFTDGRALVAMRQLDPAGITVIYCGGGDCHASEQVYIFLQQAGFTQLHILTDGAPGWTAAAHPWEKDEAAP